MNIYKEKDLLNLSIMLNKIPVDENNDIQIDFHLWQKGTNKDLIKKWIADYKNN